MKQTTRQGESPDQNFVEVTDYGLSPHVEVNINSKGTYQYSIKLYFRDSADLAENAVSIISAFDAAFRAKFPLPREK